jgi:flagellar motor switch protein FliN/FliY
MADDNLMSQDEIERLLAQAKAEATGGTTVEPAAAAATDSARPAAQEARGAPPPDTAPKKPAVVQSAPPPAAIAEGSIAADDVEFLLHQAERALASIAAPGDGMPAGVAAFKLEELSGAPPSAEAATIDLVRDVELDLRIELGRTHMYLEDVLRLRRGSVVPLDKLAGDPVDIYVNGRLVARGEVLVLNENFCVRVAELIAGTNV